MNRIADFFATYKKQLLNMVYALCGCMVFGIILIATIGAFTDDMTGFPVGTMMVFFAGVAMIILYGAMMLQTKFDLQLSMGATRKQVILQYAVFMLLSVLIFWLGGFLCLNVERFIQVNLMKLPPETETIYSVVGKICWGMGRIYLVETGMAILLASTSMRWGRWVWWTFYVFFILMCQVPNLMNIRMKETSGHFYTNVLDVLTGNSVQGWLVCTLLLVVMTGLGWFILRKQRVTL